MLRRSLALLFTGALAASPALAQDRDWSKIEVKTTTLGGGVSALAGAGGNIGVFVSPDGVLLIDDQFAPLTPKVKAAVAGLTDKPVRLVINTHWHGDHVGGNANLAKDGAVIVAQANVRKRMSEGQVSKLMARTTPPAAHEALPVITFDRDVAFHLGEETIRAYHVDHAHTDGDVIVRFEKANVIHMGDTFFNGRYPIIDIDSGGSVDGVIAAVDKVMPWIAGDTKLIPGHGPIADKQALVEYRTMVADVRDAVRALVKKKKTLAQVQAEKPTAKYDAKWGQPERFVEMVYLSLTAN